MLSTYLFVSKLAMTSKMTLKKMNFTLRCFVCIATDRFYSLEFDFVLKKVNIADEFILYYFRNPVQIYRCLIQKVFETENLK